jgi:ferredoxin-NADP reductase/fatty acid desaturase
MSFAFSASTREVLEQVVRDPRFRNLTRIPVVAPVHILLIAAAYALFIASTYWWLRGAIPLATMIAINSVAIYAAFTPLHDATHRTVSGNRAFNDLLGTISCFALLPGITTRIYRYLHLEHHRFTGDRKKDPDEPFVSAHPLLLPFVLATPDALWTVWYLRHWSGRPVAERLEFTAGILVYIGWHAAWLASPFAYEFIVAWIIPQRIGLTTVTYFFAHIQHPEDVLWEEAPFQTTVHIKTNPLFRHMMLSQTEHCLHHLLPSVPFYRYHRAWEAGKMLFERQNIPVRGFFTPIENLILPQKEMGLTWEACVRSVYDVGEGVRAYELTSVNGKELPAFEAGAHIDVQISDACVRQYSMCNSPSDTNRYLIAVKKEINGRGGSQRMHDTVTQGQILRISAPRNNFPLKPGAKHYVLIGGGIGMTPILSMAHTLHEAGASFEMHLCVRSRDHLPFADFLVTVPFRDRVHFHLDDGEDAQKLHPEKRLKKRGKGRELYICGPSAFMDWVIAAARANSCRDTAIHSETFVPRIIETRENKPFEVVLARSGKALHVAADEFLIDVLNKNKCGVPCSCTQGICGSCITPVVEGEPDHRDAILSVEERNQNKKMCVCVGRAKGDRLVLDL